MQFGILSRIVKGQNAAHCRRCSTKMRRLNRKGLLAKKLFPYFGYYPWECPVCRETFFYKDRGVRVK